MSDGTTNTSASTGSSAGIAEAASAWQDVLTPSRKAKDTDDDQGEAQQPAKPTGKRAAVKPEPEAEEADGDQDDTPQADADDEGEAADEGDDDGDDQGDEGQEAEGEESEADPDAEEGDEADSDLKAVYTVEHADGTSEDLPVEELVKGYYRQKDYTRKTQALAEDRRVVHQQHEEVVGMRTQYAQGLQQLQAAIAEVMPQEPDWETLKRADPIGYAETWADYQRRQVVIQQIEQERQAIAEQEQAEQAAHRRETVQRGQQWLLDQIPEWKDPAKRQAERSAMKAYALKMGYTEQELKDATDPRAMLLIRQAWQFAKLQEKKGTVIKPKAKTPQAAGTKTPVLKPLAVKQPQSKQASRLTDAKKRLGKEQSVAAAAGYFQTLL